MKKPKHKTPTFYRMQYNGASVKVVREEEQLFDLPGSEVDIADYDVVDMWQVSVLHRTSKTPADLLRAHHTRPVRVHGIVSAYGEKWLLKFPVVSGYSVEDGDQGLDGNCKLFALGNCRWYRIRSASEMFNPMLVSMHAEARIYWALRDARGTWMNKVDTIMETEHPTLIEGTETWTRTQEQVAVKLEHSAHQSPTSYWRIIHGQQKPKPEKISAREGEQMGRAVGRYLLQHMIIDQASFLWKSSRIFTALGSGDRDMRDQVYKMYNIPIPKDENGTRAVSPQEHLPGEERTSDQAHVTSGVDQASTSTVIRDDVVDNASRKRKRSPTKSESDSVCVHPDSLELENNKDKSRGWNEFEKIQRPILAQKHPTLSKKSLNKKLGKLYQESKTIVIKTEDDEHHLPLPEPKQGDEDEVEMTKETIGQGSLPWSNIKGTSVISRVSEIKRKNPFTQLVGSSRKQSTLTLETLQSLLYEEEVDDLCIADMIHVWRRDFREHTEKVGAIVISFARELLLGLSMTDRRHPSARQRGEPVVPENIWRATTLYDQIYKIHKIDGQDSDLLALIDWEAQDIFCALEHREGTWHARDPGLFQAARSSRPRRCTSAPDSIIDLDAIELDRHGETTLNLSTAAGKGTSSLRPRSMMNTSRFIRNGAGHKLEVSPKLHKPKRIKSESVDQGMFELQASEYSSTNHFTAGQADARWTTSEQFTQSRPDPISQLRRYDYYDNPNIFSRLVVKRSPDTLGNNADIWRCRMPSCYFFQDNVHTIESQQAIAEHYNAHADAALEGLDLLGQAGYGDKTAALLHKLENEAQIWTQAMNTDLLLLGN